MSIVDDLLANPGLCLGIDAVLDPATPDRIRGHIEHTVVARTHDGGVVTVIGHEHANSVAVLRETEPGVFELGPEGSPFPMKVELSMPEPGRLRHVWWYDRPGGSAVVRDVAVLQRGD